MNSAIETFIHNGAQVRLYIDEYPVSSPRTWSNLGTIVCFDTSYHISDTHTFDSPEAFEAFLKDTPCVVLPIYLYDHSSVSISTTPFSCHWDSGQVGYIYATLDAVQDEFEGLDAETIALAESVLRCEIDTFNMCLNGDVYRYTVTDADGTEVDACSGYYSLGDARDAAIGIN